MLPPRPGSGTPPDRAQVGRNRAARARGKLGFFLGGADDPSPDRHAEVGDHFGQPQGVQVKALNSEF